MENTEGLLLELDEFNRKSDECQDVPLSLENFIEYVAKTGTYIFPWFKVKKLYLQKTKSVLNNLNLNSMSSSQNSPSSRDTSEVDYLKTRILERFKSFTNAPFTIQRISELLLKPANNYTQQEKYLRGLEKCLMVVTTVDPSGNKILVETNGFTNGSCMSESEETMSSKAPATPVLNETDVSMNNVEMSTEVSETSVCVSIESNVVTTQVHETHVMESVSEHIAEKISETTISETTISETIVADEQTSAHDEQTETEQTVSVQAQVETTLTVIESN